ncbi:recombinase family protein [Alicyclobacillus dauci]|uniref:Recombinase family protein n=1 Tax=Alicyclobacillus dauci TaxID=1475485 RepID=A0ABY6Z7K3_9BACL|nr:recombinase family protein [Alicyclobacillus dauci]WAH38156.1 recombinase family protein [Alicyclobacillus dauci]
MVTCAIYARVSDESQVRGESIGHQISFAKAFAQRKTIDTNEIWETPEELIFVDEGITGTSLVKRPQVQRLIRAARERAFQVVLFKGISRFARDTVDALIMLRTLTACGVRVISMEENYDSQRDSAEFVFTIHSALAQAESEKTAIRVRMGAMEKAKSGKWNGRVPDGYVLNHETKHLEIDEAFSPVIEEVFNLYVGGMGCRRIAESLNERSIYTKHGNPWSARQVARLLQNPAYVGDVVYGRRTRQFAVPDESHGFARRKITKRVEHESHVVVCEGAHPPIVSRELFERVQEIVRSRETAPGRTGNIHLLTRGILRCTCGSSMAVKYNGHGTPYYRCVGQMDKGRTFCKQKFLRADAVEEAILCQVRNDVSKVLCFDDVVEPRKRDGRVYLREVDREITQQHKRTRLMFAKFAEGHLSEEQFAQVNRFIKQRLEFLYGVRKKLSTLKSPQPKESEFERRVRGYVDMHLGDTKTHRRRARELLELLVDHVDVLTVRPGVIELSVTYRFADRHSSVVE